MTNDPTIIARSDHQWWSLEHGNRVKLDRRQVLEALSAPLGSSTSGARRIEQAPPDHRPPAEAWLAPTAHVTALLRSPWLVIEDRQGNVVLLGADDIIVLDAIGPGSTVSVVGASIPGISRAQLLDSVARLERGGCLRVVEPSALDEAICATGPDPRVVSSQAPTASSEPVQSGKAGIPVYAVWQREVGPVLSLGMLTSAARHSNEGRLNEVFEIRRPETEDSFLEHLAAGEGPAVLLCSDYVWSVAYNLELARRATSIRSELVVIHGGPSCPGYPAESARFLEHNPDAAHVLVHGEGEVTLCELLDAIASADGALDPPALSAVAGISYRNEEGTPVRTPDRSRVADLDTLPSPYLTGEFDHIPASAWPFLVSIEASRGCPYGCTFCDWGSATLSRIRKFDTDRVRREVEWASAREILGIQLCDANFGILARDVEIAAQIAAIRRSIGFPAQVAFTPAKNTIKHLSKIFDLLLAEGIVIATAISLQTTDPTTLETVARSNISTDAYLELAADLRRRGQPLEGDLLIGMPGQTYESYRDDLQFFMDHDITPRTWHLQLLPNAPMNSPEYRARHRVEADSNGIIISTATMSASDRERMRTLRKVQVITSRHGVLGHVLRFLQWDHAIPATETMETLVSVATRQPAEVPAIRCMLDTFDLVPAPLVGWHHFYREVRWVINNVLGIRESSALETAFAVQEFVMPRIGRRLPETRTLPHDYVTWFESGMQNLDESGHRGSPSKLLSALPPGEIAVSSDPLGLCARGASFEGDSRNEIVEGTFWMGVGFTLELPNSTTARRRSGRTGEHSRQGGNRSPAIGVETTATLMAP